MNLDLLKFQEYLKFETKKGVKKIYDPIRQKYFVLQPEELVRQLFIAYLIHDQNISPKVIQVEKQFKYQNSFKRYDILVYKNAEPFLLIECKAFDTKLSTDVVQQISVYNFVLKVPFLVITNGKESYSAEINFEEESYKLLNKLPKLNG